MNIYDRFSSKNDVLYNNGLAVLDDICLNAEIKEVANGEYGLTAKFIIDKDINKHEFITEEAILKVKDVYGDEIFRIQTVDKSSNGRIEIYANHITKDTKNLFLEDVRPTELNGQGFLDWIFTRTTTSHEFTYSSDITKTGTAYYINKNLYESLFTLDNSFLNKMGGEVARRQYNIAINSKIGSDTGVTIRSGKNLTGFKASTDIDTVVTRIYPKGKDDLQIPEKYIDSQYIGNYPNIKSQEVVFNNIGIDEENGITQAMAQAQLRDAVTEMYSKQQVDLLKGEYKITFAPLEKTEEYKDFSLLERVWLGDTVHVYEEQFDINISVRVIERRWNVLKQVHNSITLSNVVEKSMSNLNKIISLLNTITDTNTGFLQQAKENATQIINNGIVGSNIVVRKNELLTMDTIDINTAIDVWRWNIGGFAFSENGYAGPYKIAITQDGHIVADFIDVGTLNANIIKAGYLRSLNNKTWINMENGTFNFNDKITWDGTNFRINGNVVTGVIQSNDGSCTINLDTGVVSFSKGIIQGLNSSWDLTTGLFTTQKTVGSNTYQLKIGDGEIYSDYYLQLRSRLTAYLQHEMDSSGGGHTYNSIYANGDGCRMSASQGNIFLQTFNGNGIQLRAIGGGTVSVDGNFTVSGNKNCLQETKNYGKVPFYSTEDINSLLTKTPIDEIYKTQYYESTGKYKCIVPISNFIRECINTDLNYNVWLTKLGQGDIWLSGTYSGYFVVEADREVSFKYKLEGRRRNFEDMNEEKYLDKFYNEEVI